MWLDFPTFFEDGCCLSKKISQQNMCQINSRKKLDEKPKNWQIKDEPSSPPT